jgi:hypothetical protein
MTTCKTLKKEREFRRRRSSIFSVVALVSIWRGYLPHVLRMHQSRHEDILSTLHTS